MSGYILHADEDRVVIATTKSENHKIGDMIQIWILHNEISPTDAVRSGLDSIICGDCKLRGTDGWKGRTCYVNVAQGPSSVWRAYKAGWYEYLPQCRYAEVFGGRAVRFGAYGDPVYIPLTIVRYICFFARRWTGYTHQWTQLEHQGYRDLLMASTDTAAERDTARAHGWRTFRVRSKTDGLLKGEILCPASDEAGRKTTCEKCGLCNGKRGSDSRADIAIIAHGIGARNLVQIGA